MFEEDARDALIQYLGYSIQPQPQEEEEEEEVIAPVMVADEKPAVEAAMITAEDLFATSPLSQPNETPVETETPVEAEVRIENETPAVETPMNEEWNDELKQSIIVGDFVTAVATCFKYHQYADAFVIAAWGGAELMEKTTVTFILDL